MNIELLKEKAETMAIALRNIDRGYVTTEFYKEGQVEWVKFKSSDAFEHKVPLSSLSGQTRYTILDIASTFKANRAWSIIRQMAIN